MCKTKVERWHIAAINPQTRQEGEPLVIEGNAIDALEGAEILLDERGMGEIPYFMVPLRAAPPTKAVKRARRLGRLVRLVHGYNPIYAEGTLSLLLLDPGEDLNARRRELDARLEEDKSPSGVQFAQWYRYMRDLGGWRVKRWTLQYRRKLEWERLADPEWSSEEVLDLFAVELATLLARRDRSEEFEELFAAWEGYFRQEGELARTWLNDGKEDEAKEDINLHATSVLQHRNDREEEGFLR
jgi:hypothetical protein